MKTTTTLLLFCFTSFSMYAQYAVTTYSGDGSAGFKNGKADTATYNEPAGICMDKQGNIYIADGGNNCIRKITSLGIVSTYAGTGTAGYMDGVAGTALFNDPFDVFADDSGNVFISDFNNQRIRKITFSGMVLTIAGSGTAGYLDGAALTAQFDYPRGICADKQGNVYISDSWNHRIRKLDNAGNVTTYAGGGSSMGVSSVGALVNASDTAARFYTPCGLAIDKSGNIYVADAYNHRIREINTLRVVTTLCGSGTTGPGNGGFADGSSTTAIFNTPTEVFSDSLGNLLVGDTYNNRVRKADNIGNVTTIAGTGTAGFVNGTNAVAEFNHTRGVTSNVASNEIYVIDGNNNAIRLITGSWEGIETLKPTRKETIEIYPNPASDNVTVLLNSSKNETFKVFDVFGREVTKDVFVNSIKNQNSYVQINLNIGKLSQGLYFIQFSNSNLAGKIMKE